MTKLPFLILTLCFSLNVTFAQIQTSQELVDAITNGSPNDTVLIGSGTFLIPFTLIPKEGMVIQGAGKCQTVLQPVESWDPGTEGLPDNGVKHQTAREDGYLFNIKSDDITISDMTLQGSAKLHGAVLGKFSSRVKLHHLKVVDFIWSGIRTYAFKHAQIHDITFIDAGGKQKPTTGGSLYLTWTKNSEIWNNIFIETDDFDRGNFYAIKGREMRDSRIHHNSIMVFGDFPIEIPHDNDHNVEIDHNYLPGPVSIPKGDGGFYPNDGYAYDIHHNYFSAPYSLEWHRRGVKVHHNLFDFKTEQDYGNLISGFASSDIDDGEVEFYNNLIKNPGRGVYWNNGPFDGFKFYNNHVIANTTITPRKEGLFGMNKKTDFSTIVIKDNIFEINGLSRPLMRNEESRSAIIENNTLMNVSDADKYDNPETNAPRGILDPLDFYVGAYDAFKVTGWDIEQVFEYTNNCCEATCGFACEAPDSIWAESVTPTSSLLSWSSSPYADSYRIKYKRQETDQWEFLLGITDTTFIIEDLDERGMYSWTVGADCDSSQTLWALPSNFQTDGFSLEPVENLNFAFQFPKIFLSWTDVSELESGFIIERKSSEGTFSPIDTLPANSSLFTDSLETVKANYTYRIKTFHPDFDPGISEEVFIKTEISTSISTGENIKDVLIYPNPARDYIEVLNLKGVFRIQWWSMYGKLLEDNSQVFSTTASNLRVPIPPHLSGGIYLLRIIRENRSVYTKRIQVD
ncbi:MAG: T9SS type A sorting domain-containing protein [Bacteroidota bacterium]